MTGVILNCVFFLFSVKMERELQELRGTVQQLKGDNERLMQERAEAQAARRAESNLGPSTANCSN